MSNEKKLERWIELHVRDLMHGLNDDEEIEHDTLENDLIEAGWLDDSGPQTFVTL